MTEPTDPYKVLQVDPEAEDEVIQAAYRRLARKYHPDVAQGPEAAARMSAINSAWAILGDVDQRAAHDRARAAATGPFPSAGRAPAPGATPPGDTVRRSDPAAAAGFGGASGVPRPPETVSSDWTSGRSGTGSGYDPSRMRAPDGFAAAGPPPGDPSGSVLNFGRFAGWSLGEIARSDLEYIEWLDRMPIGRPYRDEIDAILRRTGRRQSATTEAQSRHGLFRRR